MPINAPFPRLSNGIMMSLTLSYGCCEKYIKLPGQHIKQLLVYTLYSTNACFATTISSLLFALNCICCKCKQLNKQRLDFFFSERQKVPLLSKGEIEESLWINWESLNHTVRFSCNPLIIITVRLWNKEAYRRFLQCFIHFIFHFNSE